MTISEHLYSDIVSGKCVIFAGAGISTEGGPYSAPTLYETIRVESGFTADHGMPFPDLMGAYCAKVDGGHKNRLIGKIIARIESFSSPGEKHHVATSFHRSLSTIPFFRRIVTTNWDPFFEREMNVLVPMVEDRDVPFWNDDKRQVIKIHGCVTRPYTIVVTNEDYENCIQERRCVFDKVRDLMSTRSFIYVGYSLRDPDLLLILDELIQRLGKFRRLCYVVDPLASEEGGKYAKSRGIELIKVDGTGFLDGVRARLEKDNLIPSYRFLGFLAEEEMRILSAHTELSQESEGGLLSAMYQDGLLHGLQFVANGAVQGLRREDFVQEKSTSELHLLRYRERKNSVEVAYCSGRYEVAKRFCARDVSLIPTYFDPNTWTPIQEFRP
jgi:hypothetical protein